MDNWAIELEKKINQRNFHKLFKAKKKIGKALKRGKKVKAKVVATFTDEAGNTAKETAKVTLK